MFFDFMLNEFKVFHSHGMDKSKLYSTRIEMIYVNSKYLTCQGWYPQLNTSKYRSLLRTQLAHKSRQSIVPVAMNSNLAVRWCSQKALRTSKITSRSYIRFKNNSHF